MRQKMGMGLALVLLALLAARVSPATASVYFTQGGQTLPAAYGVAVVASDFTNDGKLDLAVFGAMVSTPYTGFIYKQTTGQAFEDIEITARDAAWPCLAAGDYDNDGDVDVFVAGIDRNNSNEIYSTLYRNDGSETFTSVTPGIAGVSSGSAAAGDYDNDGDLDILIAGSTATGSITRVYRNDGDNSFTDIEADLPGMNLCSVAWIDIDGDGDVDILLSGNTASGLSRNPYTDVYINDGAGAFDAAESSLGGRWASAVAWGDADNDGDPDVVVSGYADSTTNSPTTTVYTNNGSGVFTSGASLPGIAGGSVMWGDYDNDGDMDVLCFGYAGSSTGTGTVIRNNGDGTYTDVGASLPQLWESSASWADVDNDGDLDILVAGTTTGDPSGALTRIYYSNGGDANTAPSAPDTATSDIVGGELVMSWNAGSDSETPTDGLTYNIRVGTTAGGDDIVSAMVGSGGYRRVVGAGNAGGRLSATVAIPAGLVYWSVQTIDGSYEGSALFAGTVPDITAPSDVSDLAPDLVGSSSISLTWTAPGDDTTSGTAAEYDLRWSTAAITANNFHLAAQATGEPTPSAAGSGEEYWKTGLSASTWYWFALKTSDEAGNWSGISNVVNVKTTGGGLAAQEVTDRGESASMPVEFALGRAEPNPVRDETTIRFDLPKAERVRLEVFDAQGRRVARLADGWFAAGFHSIDWNRRGEGGVLQPGVYLYRVHAGAFRDQKKLVILP